MFPRLLREKFHFMQNKHYVVLFLSHILFAWWTISHLLAEKFKYVDLSVKMMEISTKYFESAALFTVER